MSSGGAPFLNDLGVETEDEAEGSPYVAPPWEKQQRRTYERSFNIPLVGQQQLPNLQYTQTGNLVSTSATSGTYQSAADVLDHNQ